MEGANPSNLSLPSTGVRAVAQLKGMPAGSYSVLHLDCASLESVRQFAEAFRATGRRLDALVCNAAVYLPTDKVSCRYSINGLRARSRVRGRSVSSL